MKNEESDARKEPPSKEGGQQIGGMSRHPPHHHHMEARRDWGPEPKAGLSLKPDRSPGQGRASGGKHLHLLLGAPSCFTPHHATGAVPQSGSLFLGVSKMKPGGYRAPVAQRPPPASQGCWQR